MGGLHRKFRRFWSWDGEISFFLGVFCSVAAYFFWYEVLRNLSAVEKGVFLYVNPVVPVVLSILFLEETVFSSMVTGDTFVFLETWFVSHQKMSVAPRLRDFLTE